jgi:hypothetical protein
MAAVDRSDAKVKIEIGLAEEIRIFLPTSRPSTSRLQQEHV